MDQGRSFRVSLQSKRARVRIWAARLVADRIRAMARQWASDDGAVATWIECRRASTYCRKTGLGPRCSCRSDALRPDKAYALFPTHSRALFFGQQKPCAAQKDLLLLCVWQQFDALQCARYRKRSMRTFVRASVFQRSRAPIVARREYVRQVEDTRREFYLKIIGASFLRHAARIGRAAQLVKAG